MIFILAKVEELFMMENWQQSETLIVLSFKKFIYETKKQPYPSANSPFYVNIYVMIRPTPQSLGLHNVHNAWMLYQVHGIELHLTYNNHSVQS